MLRGNSLRERLLLVSLLFAVAVVGGIALTTYIIVSDSMVSVVAGTAQRVTAAAVSAVAEEREEIEIAGRAKGLSGAQLDAATLKTMRTQTPDLFGRAGFSSADVALYDASGGLLWRVGTPIVHASHARTVREVLDTGQAASVMEQPTNPFASLFGSAHLGWVMTHSRVELPGNSFGVLEVTYDPHSEERVIDAIRVPMVLLAFAAMFIMVVLMQTSMVWVLNLVDELRKAADSIDAGRLEDRLPELGGNEIGELAHSLNHLIERLQRRSEAQSRFVADASHELATPVAGIRGYTGILRGWGAEDPSVRAEAVDAIDRESQRMARLTGDLLNLLHADGGLVLEMARFDLNALVRDCIASTASHWIDKDVEYDGPEGDKLMMTGDAHRIEDVLSILLDNAAKYTPDGGSVAVRTVKGRDEIEIEVMDTGGGIDPEELPRIFDRFFRSNRARAGGEPGFGLGLAIARNLVEGMGGSIVANSVVGQGTVFRVTLPRGRS